jgi:subtilisin family serine protease
LTELLVVVSIIAVLVGLTFVLFTSGKKAADGIDAQSKMAMAKTGRKLEKIRPAVQAAAKAKDAAKPKGKVPGEWIVRFKPGVANPSAAAQRIAQAFGGTVKHQYRGSLNGFALQSTTASAALLQKDPAVLSVEQGQYYHLTINPTGVRRIQAVNSPKKVPYGLAFPPLAGVKGVGANGRRNIRIGPPPQGFDYNSLAVAVIDSGVDSTHPDLNVVYSRGFGPANPDGSDAVGHGTHVSGTIGARTTGATPGVFPGVPIWSLAAFGARSTTTAAILAAIDEAYFWRSKLSAVNMSFGGGFSQALNDACDNLVLGGVTVVVSAGNSSADSGNDSPASAKQVICVAAMADNDGLPGGRGPAFKNGIGGTEIDDTFASFSNWGTVVDVIAPGVQITSTWPTNIPDEAGNLGSRYNTIDGTSMAAPHVTGLAAMIAENGRLQATLPSNILGFYLPQPLPPILDPQEVRGMLHTLSTEQIPGRFDSRTYPLITGRP